MGHSRCGLSSARADTSGWRGRLCPVHRAQLVPGLLFALFLPGLLAAHADSRAPRPLPPTGGTPATAIILHKPFDGTYDLIQPFGCTGFASEFPYGNCPHYHTGVDWGLPAGTEVLAAADGLVILAGLDPNGGTYNGGYGVEVIIDHGAGVNTLYAHLSRIDVRPGQTVTQGQPIGLSGGDPPSGPNTMSGNSTGAHLHFGVENDGTWVDPLTALSDGVSGDPSIPVSSPVSANGNCGWTNVACWFQTAITGVAGSLFDAIGAGFGAAVSFFLQPLAVISVWTNTPPELTTEFTPVRDGWNVSAAVADALAVVFLLYAGIKRMIDAWAGRQLRPIGIYTARIACYLVMLNLSLPLIAAIIGAANDVVGALGIFSHGAVFNMISSLVLGTFGSSLLLGLGPPGWLVWIVIVLLVIVKMVLLLAIFVMMLYRIAWLDFAIISAPLGIFAAIWEPTAHWGRKWHDLFWSTLLQQYFQVLLLHVALDGSGNYQQWADHFVNQAIGKGDAAGAIVSTIALFLMQSFVAIVLLFAVLRVPKVLNLSAAIAAGLTTGAALMSAPTALAGMAWRNVPGAQQAAAALGTTIGATLSGPVGAYVGGRVATVGGSMMFGRPAPLPGDHVGGSNGSDEGVPRRKGPGDVTPRMDKQGRRYDTYAPAFADDDDVTGPRYDPASDPHVQFEGEAIGSSVIDGDPLVVDTPDGTVVDDDPTDEEEAI